MGLGAPWAFSACSSWPRRRPAYGQEERASSRRGDPCLPALAAAGNDLIVEHIIEFRAWREYLAALLNGLDVFLVGVHCDLAEIDRRERDQGDRRIGEGRSHVETDLIHTFGPYDFEVDTTNAVPSAVAGSVLAAWRARTRRRALWQGISGSQGTLFVPVATALV